MTALPILSMEIRNESDVVAVRQRARRIAELVGFDTQDQTRIATAVSEIARNAFEYGGGGKVAFRLAATKDKPQRLEVAIKDSGPGIDDTGAILDGRYQSQHGMGVGIVGARRLVDEFSIESDKARGTSIVLGKAFSKRQKAVDKEALSDITKQLSNERPEAEPLRILAEQNKEMALGLDELRNRQRELGDLNRELEETNRGVVALYGELEQQAEQLRKANELKTRFLSHMSHEFRTPLNSILALSDLLLKRMDGELTSEQERQVNFIKRSTESLYELVNDLLDIAKLEAGRVDPRVTEFSVYDLFSGLRGALKPLQKDARVQLIFEDVDSRLPTLSSDEGKIAQIIRNFVSNALKFTLKGEIRVSAAFDDNDGTILFSVMDTGIGIADEDKQRIFEEFSQVDSPTQRLVKGTGLGLSLCRRLAEVLQGSVLLKSELGKGSTFTLAIPPVLSEATGSAPAGRSLDILTAPRGQQERRREALVLVVDDDPAFRYTLNQMIRADDRPFSVEEAPDGIECLSRARSLKPDVIILDLQMPRRDGYEVLQDLAADPETRHIPVLISSSADIEAVAQDRIASARAFLSKRELNARSIALALDRILEGRQ